uniref:Uncharacterized protein n=1 Tax=Rhizophora mucronata TaxID=61149 RepID=A0A2P2NUY8_RHIMU
MMEQLTPIINLKKKREREIVDYLKNITKVKHCIPPGKMTNWAWQT